LRSTIADTLLSLCSGDAYLDYSFEKFTLHTPESGVNRQFRSLSIRQETKSFALNLR